MSQYSDEYRQLLEKLEESFGEKPKETVKMLKYTLKTLETTKKRNRNYDNAIKDYKSNKYEAFDMDYQSSQIFIYIVCLLILAFMFLFHIGGINYEEGLGLYLFGAIFLAAGQSIGTFVPYFGLIFLFSHGGTGMGVMASTFLSPILNNPIMTDNPPQGLFLYIGTAIALIIIGFLVTVIRNLSRTFKNHYYSIFLPVVFYIIGMGMLVVLYRNFDAIYQMLL